MEIWSVYGQPNFREKLNMPETVTTTQTQTKRRRANKKKQPPVTSPPKTTTSKLQSRQRKRARRQEGRYIGTSIDMPYIHCRLNPWGGSGAIGIPDQSDVNRILVDHRYNTTFVVGSSGQFDITILPVFPYSIYVQIPGTDTGALMNTVPLAQNRGNALVAYTTPIPEWSNIAITVNGTAGVVDHFVPLFGAVRARLVTMAFRVIYTGSSVSNSGYIVVNRDNWSFGPPAPNGIAFSILPSNSGSNYVYGVGQVMIRPLNYVPSFSIVKKDGYQGRLDQGCYALLKHASPIYEWQEVTDNVTYLTTSSQNNYAYGMSLGSTPQPNNMGTTAPLCFGDPAWSAASIAITGATPGQTFLVEIISCVEYEVDSSSQLAQLGTQPKVNLRSLDIAAQQARKQTAAASPDKSTFTKLVNAATTVGEVAITAAELGALVV